MEASCEQVKATYDTSAEKAEKLKSGPIRTEISKLNEVQLPTYMLTENGKETPILAGQLPEKTNLFTRVTGEIKAGDIIVFREKGENGRAYLEFVSDTTDGKVETWRVGNKDISAQQRGPVMKFLKVADDGSRNISSWGCFGETEIIVLRPGHETPAEAPKVTKVPPVNRPEAPITSLPQSDIEKTYHQTRIEYGKLMTAYSQALKTHMSAKPVEGIDGEQYKKELQTWNEALEGLEERTKILSDYWKTAEKTSAKLNVASNSKNKKELMSEVVNTLSLILNQFKKEIPSGDSKEVKRVEVKPTKPTLDPSLNSDSFDKIERYHAGRLIFGAMFKELERQQTEHLKSEPKIETSQADLDGKTPAWYAWDVKRVQLRTDGEALSKAYSLMEQAHKKFQEEKQLDKEALLAEKASKEVIKPIYEQYKMKYLPNALHGKYEAGLRPPGQS
jgi:hypothetical protein